MSSNVLFGLWLFLHAWPRTPHADIIVKAALSTQLFHSYWITTNYGYFKTKSVGAAGVELTTSCMTAPHSTN